MKVKLYHADESKDKVIEVDDSKFKSEADFVNHLRKVDKDWYAYCVADEDKENEIYNSNSTSDKEEQPADSEVW